ncbi:MAG: ComEC/Rec2 family competence protein [Christensenellales bacterium]|mgnify:CR=1 FL=1|jgi:competence protein ComEC
MGDYDFFKQRKLVSIALFFGIGICIGYAWDSAPISVLLLVSLLLLVLAIVLSKKGRAAIYCVCAFSLLLGIARMSYANNPALPPKGKMYVKATVHGEGKIKENEPKAQLYLANITLTDENGNKYTHPKAYWTYYFNKGDSRILPLHGQKVSFYGNVYYPSPAQNPYGFDFRLFLLQRGTSIGISGAKELELIPNRQLEAKNPFLRIKNNAVKRMNDLFGDSSALPNALLLGDRSKLDADTKKSFQLAGISHVLAISGLHISLLVYVIDAFFSKLKLNKKISNILILCFLLFYCVFLGFSSSVVRASIMAAVFLFGKYMRKRRDTLSSLALSFLIILIFKPFEIFSAGFQLSFLAVLGIILVGNRLRYELKKRPYMPLNKFILTYGATLGASLFTMPVLANTFHYAPLSALIFSPIAIWAVGVLMPAYLFSFAASFLSMGIVKALVVPPVKLFANIFELAAEKISMLPYASIRLPAIPWYISLIYYMILLLLSRYVIFNKKQKFVIIALSVIFAAVNILVSYDNSVRYLQLSVGNADSAVIEDGKYTYVIDAGKNGGDLASYILSRGRNIDALFISHLHMDHVGGLEELLSNEVPIAKIYLSHAAENAPNFKRIPEPLLKAKAAGIPILRLNKGDILSRGRVKLNVLWPDKDGMPKNLPVNDRSLALYFDLDGISLLTCGDLGKKYEMNAALPADILKSAHHGSKSATQEEFLSEVSPEYIIISVSETKEHQLDNIMQTAENLNQTLITTYEDGAILIHCKDGEINIKDWKR